MSATGLAMDIEERLEQAIKNDVDYADPGLTRLLKDALNQIRQLRTRLYTKQKSRDSQQTERPAPPRSVDKKYDGEE